MFTRCIRCQRSLGENTELAHLRVGRRIAFDSSNGRVWVVCTRCDQWNLVPIEERWEALDECVRLAATAEARGTGTELGIAQTTSGLELLPVGGLSDADIATRRYRRRLSARQSRSRMFALMLAAAVVSLGIVASRATSSVEVGLYIGAVGLSWLGVVLSNPPQFRPTVVHLTDRTLRLWPWQVSTLRLESSDEARPVIVIRRRHGTLRLAGGDAVGVLAAVLPRINGSSCALASVRTAAANVNEAEAQKRRRPWEHIANDSSVTELIHTPPERRLALEIAVTEELEQSELTARATSLGASVSDEEAIAEIADDLLVPDDVAQRLRKARESRDAARDSDAT